jgi:hypothetical protein
VSGDSRARISCTGTVGTPVVHRYGGAAGATYVRPAIVAGMPQVTMPPRLRAVFDQQRGLVSRAQALDAGMAPEVVQRLVATGEWRAVRRGFYTERESWEHLDARDGRPRLTARAAYLGVARPHVVSHDSAALFLGLPTLGQPAPLVHLTRLGPPRARTRNGIRYHQSCIRESQRLVVDGLPVLELARTAVDIAREHPLPHGVVAVDAARQRGVSLADLWSVIDGMYRWPGITTARLAVESSDPGAESVGETLGRMFLDELGIGPVQTQFEIRDESRHARCDMRVGRHLFEFDGHTKYLRVEKGGVAVLDPDRVVWEEKQRQDWLLGYRLGMSRLVWADFWGARRRTAMARVAREYALTCATFGTSIDDLAHLVVRRAV